MYFIPDPMSEPTTWPSPCVSYCPLCGEELISVPVRAEREVKRDYYTGVPFRTDRYISVTWKCVKGCDITCVRGPE